MRAPIECLTVTIGYLDMLLAGPDPLTEQQRRYLTRARLSQEVLAAMILPGQPPGRYQDMCNLLSDELQIARDTSPAQ
jgi:hypothetical protein